MKTSTKIIIALVAIISAQSWYTGYLRKEQDRTPASSIPEAAKKHVQTQAAKIADEVGRNGLKNTIYKLVKEIDHSAVNKIKADLLDTVDALNIERDKLKQVMVINTNLTIKNQKLERKIGEFATTYTHFDDHFRLLVNVPKDSAVSATFDAGYDADLIVAQRNAGNIFTGPRWYADIYSNDLRFTNKGLRTLTVKQKQPFLKADLQAITEYNFRTNTFTAGPSLNIDLGRIEVRGRYMYDPANMNWSGIVSGGYMLLRK